MNDDLANLLSNLPDGILVYNQERQEIVLVNQAFRKVFGCGTDKKDLEQKIKQKIVKPYNLMMQQQEQ